MECQVAPAAMLPTHRPAETWPRLASRRVPKSGSQVLTLGALLLRTSRNSNLHWKIRCPAIPPGRAVNVRCALFSLTPVARQKTGSNRRATCRYAYVNTERLPEFRYESPSSKELHGMSNQGIADLSQFRQLSTGFGALIPTARCRGRGRPRQRRSCSVQTGAPARRWGLQLQIG